jgi:hypothetical protein
VPIGNPFIPDAVRQAAVHGLWHHDELRGGQHPGNPPEHQPPLRRDGPRINGFDNKSQQWTAGLRGALPMFSNWGYDAYLQSGSSTKLSTRVNWGSANKFQQALRAVNTTSCTVTTGGCVPINVFGAPGSTTAPMLNFINQTAIQSTSVDQDADAGLAER